jgi:hypothetical protein
MHIIVYYSFKEGWHQAGRKKNTESLSQHDENMLYRPTYWDKGRKKKKNMHIIVEKYFSISLATMRSRGGSLVGYKNNVWSEVLLTVQKIYFDWDWYLLSTSSIISCIMDYRVKRWIKGSYDLVGVTDTTYCYTSLTRERTHYTCDVMINRKHRWKGILNFVQSSADQALQFVLIVFQGSVYRAVSV